MAFLRRLQGYWLMIHPFPVMMVVTLTTILAVATAGASIDFLRIVRVVAAVFFSQMVVGISNDYHDRLLDAKGQPWKPLARGVVKPNEARALIAIAFVLMFVIGSTLGTLALLFVLLGTFAGQLYNFWLRDTPFSWFPYVLGFVALPIFIWVSMENFDVRQLALVPIGVPLLFGVHLAQTLPDTEIDRTAGARGFAVALGRARGVVIVWTAAITAQLIALISAVWLHMNLQVVAIAATISFALIIVSIALYHRQPTSETLRAIFRLVAPSAVILIAGWLFGLHV